MQKQVEYLHKLTEEGQQVLEKLVGEAKKERQTEAKNNNNKEISLNTYIYTSQGHASSGRRASVGFWPQVPATSDPPVPAPGSPRGVR